MNRRRLVRANHRFQRMSTHPCPATTNHRRLATTNHPRLARANHRFQRMSTRPCLSATNHRRLATTNHRRLARANHFRLPAPSRRHPATANHLHQRASSPRFHSTSSRHRPATTCQRRRGRSSQRRYAHRTRHRHHARGQPSLDPDCRSIVALPVVHRTRSLVRSIHLFAAAGTMPTHYRQPAQDRAKYRNRRKEPEPAWFLHRACGRSPWRVRCPRLQGVQQTEAPDRRRHRRHPGQPTRPIRR